VVIDSQRLDLVLCAGRATGARDPLAMTDAELATATQWLTRLRPNVRRVVRQRSEIVEALASGACTLAIAGLGVPDQVLDAGGPELMAFVRAEGTIGSLEAEVVLRDAPNAVRVPAWIDAAASAEALAASFLIDAVRRSTSVRYESWRTLATASVPVATSTIARDGARPDPDGPGHTTQRLSRGVRKRVR